MDAHDVANDLKHFIDERGLTVYGVHAAVNADEIEHRWRSDDRENIYSISKGVSALAAGIAINEGLISLDTPVSECFDFEFGAGAANVTLENLLSMTSGIAFSWFGDQESPWPDLAQEMLSHDSTGRGERFLYSDASTYVAMRMLERRTGDVRDWLLPRLFEPLGIHNPQWHRCPQGYIVGGSGLELRTSELARIGRVLRDNGRWQGTPVVDEAWITRMHSNWVDAGGGQYGLATWRGPHGSWRLVGRYGQYIVVSPENDAVVTVTAHEESPDEPLLAGILRSLGI